MNPYLTFNKLGNVRSLDAILTKNSGATLALHVKTETLANEQFQSDYDAAIQVRTWSVDVAELTTDNGVLFPEGGDVLTVTLENGTVKAYPATRNPQTARFWDWAFTRPGYRVHFYTRFDGALLNTSNDGDLGNNG